MPVGPAPVVESTAALHPAVQAEAERALTEVDLGVLTGYLMDIRDLTGSQEAVFWRWSESRAVLAPWAWSTENVDRPAHFRMSEWGPRVRSVAESRQPLFLGGRRPFFAATPVSGETRLHGVLSLAGASGIGIERSDAEEWLRRHATHVAMLMDLFDVRRAYGRSLRQSRALLRAAEEIYSHSSTRALAGAVCDMAINVTSADAAALIRCGPGQARPTVQHVTGPIGASAGLEVHPESLIAAALEAGAPVLVGDATGVARGQLFGNGDRFGGSRSLAVVPIRLRDDVVGCLVISSGADKPISDDEVQNIGVLAALAATALDMVWRIEEASRRAETDALTGLANRRRLDDALQRELSQCDRFGHSVALVLVDLDFFKSVNDEHGHEAGDAVLCAVARILVDSVRTVDLCARFGGEEMAILLPQTTATGAFELADRLRRRLAARPIRAEKLEISVTASFGVASYPDTVRCRDELFAAADAALYRAKRDGRNCVKVAERSDVAEPTYELQVKPLLR